MNGIELAKGSSLATLRAACSFLGISGSGSKLKDYTKTLNRNKNDGIVARQKLGE